MAWLVYLFVVVVALFRIAWWASAEKELSSWFSFRAFYFMPTSVFESLSRLVSWAICDIQTRPRPLPFCQLM